MQGVYLSSVSPLIIEELLERRTQTMLTGLVLSQWAL
jgi:hypothetical protein